MTATTVVGEPLQPNAHLVAHPVGSDAVSELSLSEHATGWETSKKDSF